MLGASGTGNADRREALAASPNLLSWHFERRREFWRRDEYRRAATRGRAS